MSLTLTDNARNAADQTVKKPQLVLEIEGVPTKYGAARILKYVRIGDPDLYIGDDWRIGGFNEITGQDDLITFDGTTTQIVQQLQPDRGLGSSVSSMQIALVDQDDKISQLISPGMIVTDLLGRRAKLWLGFAEETAFPDDFVIIFRGVIDDIVSKSGVVVINIAHPDQKKRQSIFIKGTTNLNGAIGTGDATITVDSTANFLTFVLGPSGAQDTSLRFYIRIEDELIEYTGKTGTTFTGCVRGQLGTLAAAHADDSTVDSFYRLTGNMVDLALKLMLSKEGYWTTGVDVKSFNYIDPSLTVSNAIFFENTDVSQIYSIVAGDYITTAGAANGANNVTLKTIASITKVDNGSYIVVNGVTFVDELDSAATISFRSKYDTLPVGAGMGMAGDEVDVTQHERLKQLFLSSITYDFYLKDTVQGKDFLEQEIYLPAACFSVPRNAQSSMNYHIGPIPGQGIKKLTKDNVKLGSRIALRRTTTRNFFNTIVHRFDENPVEDKFLGGVVSTDATSKTQIPVGTKSLTITSKGLRTANQAVSHANLAQTRMLNRYKFGAEFFEDIQVLYKDGLTIEIGDILIFDTEGLKVTNTETGVRD